MSHLSKSSLRSATACSLLGLICVFLAGCSNLVISTMPPGGSIVLKDANGRVLTGGPAPLAARVSFASDQDKYVVEAVPSEATKDRYLPTVKELAGAQFSLLPEPSPGVKEFEVKLDEKNYTVILDVNIFLGDGWMGEIVPSRAYNDVSEVGGAVPQKLVDLGENLGFTGLVLSPDGERIIFSAAAFDSAQLQRMKTLRLEKHEEIRIATANILGVGVRGGGIQHITREEYRDMYPCFTTDGKNLLFSSNRRDPKSTDLLQISASGRGGVTNINIDPRGRRSVKASLSNAGTITFALYPEHWSGPQDVEIWTIDSNFTQIVRGVEPAISPDGKKIAYIGGDGNLWVVNIDGTQATQLTSSAKDILDKFRASLADLELQVFDLRASRGVLLRHYHPYSYPAWSPDGKQILFTSMQGVDASGRPNEDIWNLNLVTQKMQQLTTNGSVDRFPVMSPDGKWVYFLSNRGGSWCIWRIAAPAGE